jgi:hypothetical protein
MQRSCERGVEKLLPKKSQSTTTLLERHAGLAALDLCYLFVYGKEPTKCSRKHNELYCSTIVFSVALVYGVEL